MSIFSARTDNSTIKDRLKSSEVLIVKKGFVLILIIFYLFISYTDSAKGEDVDEASRNLILAARAIYIELSLCEASCSLKFHTDVA